MKSAFLFAILVATSTLASTANDSLVIINPTIKEISSSSQCILTYRLVSNAKNTIHFQNYLQPSDWDNPYSDIWILLEKKELDKFSKVQFEDALLDMISQADANKLSSLSPNDSLAIQIDLRKNYHSLKKGEYRFKIQVHFAKDSTVTDATSDWIYFKIANDL